MLFDTSCTHLTVTVWIEKMLLPVLRPGSLVVMDNAPFHNKPKIIEILERHGHKLLPLPKYSPDLNPCVERPLRSSWFREDLALVRMRSCVRLFVRPHDR